VPRPTFGEGTCPWVARLRPQRCRPRLCRTTIEIRSPMALHRLLSAPGELGLARTCVAGDIEVHADFYTVLSLRDLRNDPIGPCQ